MAGIGLQLCFICVFFLFALRFQAELRHSTINIQYTNIIVLLSILYISVFLISVSVARSINTVLCLYNMANSGMGFVGKDHISTRRIFQRPQQYNSAARSLSILPRFHAYADCFYSFQYRTSRQNYARKERRSTNSQAKEENCDSS